MLITPVDYLMDERQTLRWHESLLTLRALEIGSDSEDPWLFHGTSQGNARIIAEEGFDPRTSYVFVPDSRAATGKGTCTLAFSGHRPRTWL